MSQLLLSVSVLHIVINTPMLVLQLQIIIPVIVPRLPYKISVRWVLKSDNNRPYAQITKSLLFLGNLEEAPI